MGTDIPTDVPVLEMPMAEPERAGAESGITLVGSTKDLAADMSDLEMKGLIIETFRFAQEIAGRVRKIEEFCSMLNTLMTSLGQAKGIDRMAANRIVGADNMDIARMMAAQAAQVTGAQPPSPPANRAQRRAK